MKKFKVTVKNMRQEMNKVGKAPAAKLAFLQRWANLKRQSVSPTTLAELRAAHWRAGKKPLATVGKCWACNGWADLVRHHIIQLQSGGSNWHLNIVRICGECHRRIHPWLSKPVEATLDAPEEPPIPF
jgi:5-methylcytosine-specific restriction endonuclease McrA